MVVRAPQAGATPWGDDADDDTFGFAVGSD
jgi:hypothetical protein